MLRVTVLLSRSRVGETLAANVTFERSLGHAAVFTVTGPKVRYVVGPGPKILVTELAHVKRCLGHVGNRNGDLVVGMSLA